MNTARSLSRLRRFLPTLTPSLPCCQQLQPCQSPTNLSMLLVGWVKTRIPPGLSRLTTALLSADLQ